MYSFFIVAVANYHKVSDLNINLLYYGSGGKESKIGLTGIRSRFWQNCAPSEGPRGDSISLSFPASRSYLYLFVGASSSIFKPVIASL